MDFSFVKFIKKINKNYITDILQIYYIYMIIALKLLTFLLKTVKLKRNMYYILQLKLINYEIK